MRGMWAMWIAEAIMWLAVGAAIIVVFIHTQRIAVMLFFLIPLFGRITIKIRRRHVDDKQTDND